MIQVEQGSWSIPIAPQGAVERTFASRKLDVNVAYRIDIRAVTFPAKKGSEHLGAAAPRIAKFDLVVIEPGFEGIEREINMGLPQTIPQGADDKTLRSLLFNHELWYNMVLSLGYNEQTAKQIVQQGGVTPAVFANAPGRGQAYMYVEEDEYESVVKDPTTGHPQMDVTTGQPKKEIRKGEDRKFCSATVHQKNGAAAARAAKSGQQQPGNQPGAGAPPAFAPSNVPPAMIAAAPSYNAPANPGSPFGGAPGAPAPAAVGSPFAAPNGAAPGFPGAVPSGPMGTLATPRA